jgi:hypothetical protein
MALAHLVSDELEHRNALRDELIERDCVDYCIELVNGLEHGNLLRDGEHFRNVIDHRLEHINSYVDCLDDRVKVGKDLAVAALHADVDRQLVVDANVLRDRNRDALVIIHGYLVRLVDFDGELERELVRFRDGDVNSVVERVAVA